MTLPWHPLPDGWGAALVWTVTCLTLGGLLAWAVSACEPVIGEPVPVQVDAGFRCC